MISNRFLIVSICCLIAVESSLRVGSKALDKDDANKTVGEYITSYGYRFEEHKIETQDGYILTLWRIPCKQSESCGSRPPIFLMHGILDNGFSFLFQKIDKNLPIILSNKGYDVWIGNIRGTIYTLEHRDMAKYDPSNYSGIFYDYSWDEMAKYDLPAMLDHVQKVNGHEKLDYICHSQGCLMLYALGATEPEYVNKRVRSVVGFAPAMFFYYQESLGIDMLRATGFLENLERTKQKNVMAQEAYRQFCAETSRNMPLTFVTTIDFFTGWRNVMPFDLTRIPVLGAHEPGGTSLQNLRHWFQWLENPTFRMHDFGKDENMRRYKQPTPPSYNTENLAKLSMKQFLISGEKDALVTKRGLSKLYPLIRPDLLKTRVLRDANHLDVIWADYLSVDVFPGVIEFLGTKAAY